MNWMLKGILLHPRVILPIMIVVILTIAVIIGNSISYTTISHSALQSNEELNDNTVSFNSTKINVDKLVSSLLQNPTVQYVMNKYRFHIDKSNVEIKDKHKVSDNFEVTVLFKNASDRNLVLIVKCIVAKDMNIVNILQISPIVEPLANNNDRLSISKAKELISRRDVLVKIYYDTRVIKIMNQYKISFNDFMEAIKSIGLVGNRTTSVLRMQIIVFKIPDGNTTKYVVDKPGMFNNLTKNLSICPTIDIIDIYFYNEEHAVKIIGVDIQNNLLDPRCFTGPRIDSR